MKAIILILSITTTSFLQAQVGSYEITNSDTIELADLAFKRVVALHFDEATVIVDREMFMNHLTAERKGLKKKVKSRERIIKQGADAIISAQLKTYQRQLVPVDSIFAIAKQTKVDTLHIDFNVFIKAKSPFGDFLPSALERKQCAVLDLKNNKQKFIIKVSGSKKTGQMTGVGSSFYFIPGATKYFLSKMDWVS